MVWCDLGLTQQRQISHWFSADRERRRELVKKARTEWENAHISILNARLDVVDLLKKYQKDGLSEDIVKDTEILIQKEVDAFSKIVEEVLAAKEKEIMTV